MSSRDVAPSAQETTPELVLGWLKSFPSQDFERHDTVVDEETREGGLLVVTRGVLILEAVLIDGRRQVLGFRFPGDFLCTAFNHLLPNTTARALSDVSLTKVPHREIILRAGQDRRLGRALVRVSAYQTERFALQNVLLGALDRQQRVASFVLEMVLRQGRKMIDGIAIPLPMTREEIGGYLGLNADTVSRALSNLRKQKILGQINRREGLVRDVQLLRKSTPLASVLTRIYGERNAHDLSTLLEYVQSNGTEITAPGQLGVHKLLS